MWSESTHQKIRTSNNNMFYWLDINDETKSIYKPQTESWQSIHWDSFLLYIIDRMIYWHKLAHLLFSTIHDDHNSRWQLLSYIQWPWIVRIEYRKKQTTNTFIYWRNPFLLFINKREYIYIFPAEQPDNDRIGHCMFIDILNKY
jgi:hypothetical protein